MDAGWGEWGEKEEKPDTLRRRPRPIFSKPPSRELPGPVPRLAVFTEYRAHGRVRAVSASTCLVESVSSVRLRQRVCRTSSVSSSNRKQWPFGRQLFAGSEEGAVCGHSSMGAGIRNCLSGTSVTLGTMQLCARSRIGAGCCGGCLMLRWLRRVKCWLPGS